MRPIGFSTGALAGGDFGAALGLARAAGATAVELSALRESELEPLTLALPSLDLSSYSYVSFHAPSHLQSIRELDVIRLLQTIVAREWAVIVHPDVIKDDRAWATLGASLCIENMDKRKESGRFAFELSQLFGRFPLATFCFDIGHARQVDPTMVEAEIILREFGSRLRQIHWSDVDSASGHHGLSWTSVRAFGRVLSLIPDSVPVIIESVTGSEHQSVELQRARELLSPAGR